MDTESQNKYQQMGLARKLIREQKYAQARYLCEEMIGAKPEDRSSLSKEEAIQKDLKSETYERNVVIKLVRNVILGIGIAAVIVSVGRFIFSW